MQIDVGGPALSCCCRWISYALVYSFNSSLLLKISPLVDTGHNFIQARTSWTTHQIAHEASRPQSPSIEPNVDYTVTDETDRTDHTTTTKGTRHSLLASPLVTKPDLCAVRQDRAVVRRIIGIWSPPAKTFRRRVTTSYVLQITGSHEFSN